MDYLAGAAKIFFYKEIRHGSGQYAQMHVIKEEVKTDLYNRCEAADQKENEAWKKRTTAQKNRSSEN